MFPHGSAQTVRPFDLRGILKVYVPALTLRSKDPPAGKMYGSIRRKGPFNRPFNRDT